MASIYITAMPICTVVGFSETLIMVSDIFSAGPVTSMPNEFKNSPLSRLAAATNKIAAPKNLGVFLPVFIFPHFWLLLKNYNNTYLNKNMVDIPSLEGWKNFIKRS